MCALFLGYFHHRILSGQAPQNRPGQAGIFDRFVQNDVRDDFFNKLVEHPTRLTEGSQHPVLAIDAPHSSRF